MIRKALFTLVLLLLGLQSVRADVVCLNNGNIIEGILIQENDNFVEIEVFPGAKIALSQQEIAYVKHWNEDNNETIRDQWIQDKEDRLKAELARQEFEARQKSQGLVKYRGKWIEASEGDKLKTQGYIDEVLKGKTQRGEIAKTGQQQRSEIARSVLSKGNWHYRQTEHFIVYYEDVMQSKIVADRAEYYYEKIAYDLDYEQTIYWPEKCEVYIIPDEKKWEQYMEGLVERFDHIGGFVPHGGEKEIFLCALSLPYLSVTFPHELTHLIFNEFAQGDFLPLWLNEGLAIYESGLIGYADQLLRDKVKKAEHIPIKEMMRLKDYPRSKEETELFYAQSEKTVEFLITQHGRKKFSRFCQLIISNQDFARVLSAAYGDIYYSQDEFDRSWIKYVLK